MYHRMIRVGLILCVLLCGSAALARAQQPQQELTPEKRALINELLAAIDARTTVNSLIDTMLSQAEKSSEQMVADTISERGDMTPQEKEEHRKKMMASSARMNKRFRELMAQRIDMLKIMQDISYSVYYKYFTEDEIKDMIAFYKSPTGKKSIEVMPKLFSDSMTRTAEVLMPKLRQIIKEITDEELKNDETPPKPSGQQGTHP